MALIIPLFPRFTCDVYSLMILYHYQLLQPQGSRETSEVWTIPQVPLLRSPDIPNLDHFENGQAVGIPAFSQAVLTFSITFGKLCVILELQTHALLVQCRLPGSPTMRNL